MFIKWTETNVLAFPNINKTAIDQMKKSHRMKGSKPVVQTPAEVKWLRPGWNEFPTDVWEQNKDNPAIQKLIKAKKIELMSHKATITVRDKRTGKLKKVERMIGADDSPIRLKYFDEKTAIEVVKSAFDRDMLQRWEDEETRHKVKKALRKQIEPLLNTSEDKDDEDDTDDGYETE